MIFPAFETSIYFGDFHGYMLNNQMVWNNNLHFCFQPQLLCCRGAWRILTAIPEIPGINLAHRGSRQDRCRGNGYNKSPVNGGLNGKTSINCGFFIVMFDYRCLIIGGYPDFEHLKGILEPGGCRTCLHRLLSFLKLWFMILFQTARFKWSCLCRWRRHETSQGYVSQYPFDLL